MRITIRRLCALLSLVILSHVAANLAAAEQITMNMRDADIRSVVQWMSELSGKHFIIDPSVNGQLTVISPDKLKQEDAYQVFLKALELAGYTTVNDGNIVSIIANTNRSAKILQSFDGSDDSEQAVYVLPLKRLDAKKLATELKPLIPETGYIGTLGNNNSLLIADRISSIQRIKKLTEQLDQQGGSNITIVHLKHASAADAVRTVENLRQNIGNDETLSVASDTRSNSVLINGSNHKRQQIRDVLARIDKPFTRNGSTKVIYIHYLEAQELVPILKGMTGDADKSQTGVTSNVSIQVSKTSNALILTAPPPELAAMQDVIKNIDVRRKQVLVEAIIVEVNDEVSNDIGVQWQTKPAADGTFASTNFNIAGQADGTGLGQGFSLGYLRNGSLRALLNALSNDVNANLLSTPSIVTLDNQEAEILVGRNIPVVTGEQTNSTSATDNPFRTIERRDIGVSLKITPHINDGKSVTMDILQSVENISNTVASTNGIATDKRSIKTKVTVDNNEILVLGGLIRKDDKQTVHRVPVLGHIPILGKLFQRDENTTVRNNLMVFVRPIILEKKSNSSSLSKQRYNQARDLQTDHNNPNSQNPTEVAPELAPLEN